MGSTPATPVPRGAPPVREFRALARSTFGAHCPFGGRVGLRTSQTGQFDSLQERLGETLDKLTRRSRAPLAPSNAPVYIAPDWQTKQR